MFFAGHWVYFEGCQITADIPAESGQSVIPIDDPSCFRMKPPKEPGWRETPEDVVLTRLDAQGRPDWHAAEQVRLVSVDPEAKTITVERGCYGTKPLAREAAETYAAAHAWWDWGSNRGISWTANYSPCCPRDKQGRSAADLLLDRFSGLFRPGGDLYRGEIGDFNATYDTAFDSFDALLAAENWRPATDLSNANETRDNVVFLQHVVAKYYETALEAIRRYDANHLFFGDKINANTDTADTLLPITSRYTDVNFYQMYGRYEVQKPGLDRWSRIADQPIINGDSSYTMITEHMPPPYGPVADNVRQRAEWTDEFFRSAFARPEFVGWHYCGLIDATQQIARKQDRQHSGLMDAYGEPYPELKTVFRACVDEMYAIATGAA